MDQITAAEALYDEFYEWRLRDSPEFATMMGVHDYDDQLESYTLDSFRMRRDKVQSLLDRSKALDREQCQPYIGRFIEMLESYIECYDRTKSFVFPISRIEGVHVDLAQTISFMKFDDEGDFVKYAKRLSCLPAQIDGIIEVLKYGIENELTLHSVSIKTLPACLAKLVQSIDEEGSALGRPMATFGGNLSDETRASISRGINLAKGAFTTLKQFLEDTYLPKCRTDVGISSIAGQAYYQQCLKYHLGYDVSADEVHRTGLEEVERITGDIKQIISELGLSDSPKEFAERMRNESKFVLASQNSIKAFYEEILRERIQPQLSKFFRKLPKAELRLELIDESRAAGPAAFYIQGSSDGKRAGTFYINANDPKRNPTYIMPALALHEANPGHHLQTSRLLETSKLASFLLMMEDRRYTDMPTHFPMHTAYTEGWGLYSEFLGHEMGIYRDCYERYGHYSQEMLRACRLVVDTGMHSLGWSRQQAIDFLLNNTSSSRSEIESEIDRYITWPGQACGYKIGELKIKQLRQKALQKLGDKFDIRDFHEVVMNNVGTMSFLESAVDEYIASSK